MSFNELEQAVQFLAFSFNPWQPRKAHHVPIPYGGIQQQLLPRQQVGRAGMGFYPEPLPTKPFDSRDAPTFYSGGGGSRGKAALPPPYAAGLSPRRSMPLGTSGGAGSNSNGGYVDVRGRARSLSPRRSFQSEGDAYSEPAYARDWDDGGVRPWRSGPSPMARDGYGGRSAGGRPPWPEAWEGVGEAEGRYGGWDGTYGGGNYGPAAYGWDGAGEGWGGGTYRGGAAFEDMQRFDDDAAMLGAGGWGGRPAGPAAQYPPGVARPGMAGMSGQVHVMCWKAVMVGTCAPFAHARLCCPYIPIPICVCCRRGVLATTVGSCEPGRRSSEERGSYSCGALSNSLPDTTHVCGWPASTCCHTYRLPAA